MYPNRGASSSTSTTPAPGHRRGRIACSNCRKRKMKCITTEKYPRSPCERCTKEGTRCEYIAVTNDEETSSPPSSPTSGRSNSYAESASNVPKWVEPMDPESYARRKGMRPPPNSPPTHQNPPAYGNTIPPSPHSWTSFRHQPILPPYSPSGGAAYSPNQPVPWSNDPNFVPSSAVPPVHYGPFPGPANTVYPWTQQQYK
ncbi:hypothetical protein C8J57DRAFT_1478094 [Mycena rebaudengoi]|nr:hypothetical protein C8J57DRAFT_1478094 [Mycena rebaudengoi]